MPEEKTKLADAKVDFIIQIAQYMDNNNRAVVEQVVVFGEAPADFCRFKTPASMQEMTPAGPINWQFDIPLPGATTPAEAFEMLKTEAPKALEKAKEDCKKFVLEKIEAEKKRIAVASELPSSLLGAGGKPLQLPGLPPGLRGPAGPQGHGRR